MFLSPAVPIRPDTGLLARLVKSPRNLDAHLNSVLLVDRRDPARRRPAAAGQSPPVGGRRLLLAAGIAAAVLAVVTVQSSKSHPSTPACGAWRSYSSPAGCGRGGCRNGHGRVTRAQRHPRCARRDRLVRRCLGCARQPSPLIFTAGLVADSAALALAAHLLLGYPGGRLRGRARSVVVAAGYADLVGVVGRTSAILRARVDRLSPRRTSC